MKEISILLIIFFSCRVHCAGSLQPKIATATCINYNEPQDIHSTHYWDGKIHLVPMFFSGGKDFQGFAIVHLPKNSPFLKRGLAIGDIITEIDGIKPTASQEKKDNSKFFERLKSDNVKSIKAERCQKLNLTY